MQNGAERLQDRDVHNNDLIHQRSKALEELKANNPEFGGKTDKSQVGGLQKYKNCGILCMYECIYLYS